MRRSRKTRYIKQRHMQRIIVGCAWIISSITLLSAADIKSTYAVFTSQAEAGGSFTAAAQFPCKVGVTDTVYGAEYGGINIDEAYVTVTLDVYDTESNDTVTDSVYANKPLDNCGQMLNEEGAELEMD